MMERNTPKGMDIQALPPVITVVGGDARALAVARRLAETVCAVRTYALGRGNEFLDGRVLPVAACSSLWEAWAGSRVLILPLPVTRDGETVWCPLAPDSTVELSELTRAVTRASETFGKPPLIFGGCMPSLWRRALEGAGGMVVDYFDCEELQIKNAQITAEGAVMTAMELMDVTLLGSKMVVIGYGRIGQLLARMLRALGVEVTVVARRAESRAWAVSDGCHAADVTDLGALAQGYDVIFNTVPAPLLDDDFLKQADRHTLIIELASLPGGVTPEAEQGAATRGWPRIVRALSLPGRYAPVTAGRVIADCVMDVLTQPSNGKEAKL